MGTLKAYYTLAKPGIIFGNAITAAAGFFLASRGEINWQTFVAMLVGISFVIGSGCVFNNYFDLDIDAAMERTKDRVLVKGMVSRWGAIIYGIILGVIGFKVLILWTNLLTAGIALIGFVFYVFVYTWWKRKSSSGALIGTISGSVPPIVGYVAVTNRLDLGAAILFLILVLWQMPHFFAIAIYRLKEYAAAGIPILPVKKGILTTKVHMLLYIVGFLLVAPLLTLHGYEGYSYLFVMLTLGLAWLGLCITGFWAKDDNRWARRMFFFSLATIVAFCVMTSVDVIMRK